MSNNNNLVFENDWVHIWLVELLDTISEFNQLPNWTITLYDPIQQKFVDVYIKIMRCRSPIDKEQYEAVVRPAFEKWITKAIAHPEFINLFGNLEFLHPKMQLYPYPETSQVGSVYCEMMRFFDRRGKNSITKITGGFRKLTPPHLYLNLGSDTVLTTQPYISKFPTRRNNGIVGSVVLRDIGIQGVEIYHPRFDLRSRIKAEDIVTGIEQALERSFPFMQNTLCSAFTDWKFFNLSEPKQGK